MKMRIAQCIVLLTAICTVCCAQPGKENMPANTAPAYAWWNLLHYSISITPNYTTKYVRGTNTITFKALQTGKAMQVDLQQPMRITAVTCKNKTLQFVRDSNSAYIITLPTAVVKNNVENITINFEGKPKEAVNPPWDNGWIWAKDKEGRPWASIACEGSGASIWLPCKAVLYDEPDSGIDFTITVPDTLVAVANGRLQQKQVNSNGTASYTWVVVNPINNYDIIPYIGKYVTWHDDYAGIKGNLDRDYWVIDYNASKAKRHLRQTDTLLRFFEHWLGPYPFYADGYKVVEAPMPGMEHQSAIAYGNGFENGYSGKNLSGTAWGLKWDFILMHESGHEWFGNSITAADDGDSWIHEGFTKYLETLYTAWLFGNEAGNGYTQGISKRIKNDAPVVGSGSTDTYNKAAAMLHMIRQLTGDSVFKKMLYALNTRFYHSTVNTAQILACINESTGHDFSKLFQQYLQTTQVPVLECVYANGMLKYRWANCVSGFNMPVKIAIDNQHETLLYPTVGWKNLVVKSKPTAIVMDRNFYAKIKYGDGNKR